MRVVTPKKLRDYSIDNAQARIPLLNWYEIVRNASWENLSDVKQDFRTVDYVGNNRYVFNIKGNDYRIVVIIIFLSKKVYIRFIGKHDDYDKIDAKTI
jgi:mRNA interferase HigB